MPPRKPHPPKSKSPRKKSPKLPSKRGRPPTWDSQSISKAKAQIVELLKEGITLSRICRQPNMPHRSLVYDWREQDVDFNDKCVRAIELPAADSLVDTMQDIEERVLSKKLPPNAARVVLHSRQWRAGVMNRQKYGPKLDSEQKQTMTIEAIVTRSFERPALEGNLVPPNLVQKKD